MKSGWQTKTLGDVCHVYQPETISQKQMVPGEFPVYGANGQIGWHDKFNHEAPQLIFGCRGSCGTVHITEPRAWINGNAMVVQPKDGVIDISFLAYALRGGIEISDAITGAAQPQITRTSLMPLAISFPAEVTDQQRIVGILDEAFEGIATAKANAEKNLRNARALFESHLQSVFTQRGEGWVEKPLGDICDLLNGFAFKSEDVVSESQTQLVRMGNLYGNKLDLDRSPVFYPDNFAVDYSRYLLKQGDLIMSLTGTKGKEDYGYVVSIPECTHALLMNQRIAKFDSMRKNLLNKDYLLHYLRSRVFLDVLYPTANGTRQGNLSSVTIKTLPIPLCSIREQETIVSSLESLSAETQRLESIYQQKLRALEALKKSLLHQAFTGNL